MFANGDEVLRFIKDEDVRFLDVRFCDLPGVMQHFNVPATARASFAFYNTKEEVEALARTIEKVIEIFS